MSAAHKRATRRSILADPFASCSEHVRSGAAIEFAGARSTSSPGERRCRRRRRFGPRAAWGAAPRADRTAQPSWFTATGRASARSGAPECDGGPPRSRHPCASATSVSAAARACWWCPGALAAAAVHRLRDRIGPRALGADGPDGGARARSRQPVRDCRRRSGRRWITLRRWATDASRHGSSRRGGPLQRPLRCASMPSAPPLRSWPSLRRPALDESAFAGAAAHRPR